MHSSVETDGREAMLKSRRVDYEKLLTSQRNWIAHGSAGDGWTTCIAGTSPPMPE